MEYAGASQSAAFQTIEEKIRYNVREVLDRARRNGGMPRTAAVEMAVERVRTAMSIRRFSVY